MNTTHIRELNISYYVTQITYLEFVVLIVFIFSLTTFKTNVSYYTVIN